MFCLNAKKKLVILGARQETPDQLLLKVVVILNTLVFLFCTHINVYQKLQRRQMTTVIDDNVFNIAVKGNFDDCQGMVKSSFADQSFLKGAKLVRLTRLIGRALWLRSFIIFRLLCWLARLIVKCLFSVPTGNFGDIFAGYLAKKMGLPIDQLVVATNKNDILHRVITQNDMSRQSLNVTLSPSMDIMVSSNFERLLFDAHGRDGAKN